MVDVSQHTISSFLYKNHLFTRFLGPILRAREEGGGGFFHLIYLAGRTVEDFPPDFPCGEDGGGFST